MQTITTWIKRLSRARDIHTAKSLVISAIEDLSGADLVTVVAEGDELAENLCASVARIKDYGTIGNFPNR